MLEMILRLFEAKAISLETMAGRRSGSVGRDEYVAAMSHGARTHPIGWQLILAENGHDSGLAVLMEYLSRAIPNHGAAKQALLVLLGRPLPAQIDSLVAKSPYYISERRRASIVMERAKRAHRMGRDHEYINLRIENDAILRAAKERVGREIMETGRCPACHGTGRRERKQDECPVCQGAGVIYPAAELIGREYGPEIMTRVNQVIDAILIDKSECLQVMASRVREEKGAA